MTTIAEQIDRLPIQRTQFVLVALMTVALMLDGLDVKLLSYVAPRLLEDWQVSEALFSTALAGALFGMAIGSSVGGWLGDRFGRRMVILGMLALFAIATIGASLTHNVLQLTILRLVSGIGFGALTPNAIALCTEWLPRRVQPKVVAILAVGSPFGGAIGALVALWLLPAFGWRGCFIAVGLATIVFTLLILRWLPESAGFLAARGHDAAVRKVWRQMFDGAPLAEQAAVAATEDRSSVKVPREALFTRSLLRLNIGASLAFFSAYYVSYAFSSWLPVILSRSSYALSAAIKGSLVYNVLAMVGALAAGHLIARFGSRPVLCSAALTSIALLAGLGFLLAASYGSHIPAMLVLVGSLGAVAGIIASTLSSIVAGGYPTAMRATGVGMGIMSGRIGGIATTLGGGILLSLGKGGDVWPMFIVLVAMALLLLVSAFVIDIHVRRTGAATGPR